MNKINAPVITIDGPSASGKGTIAKCLAQHLEWHLLDSGAFYRAFAWGFFHDQLEYNQSSYDWVMRRLRVEYLPERVIVNDMHLFYNEQLIDDSIRNEHWAQMASKLAVLPQVRQALLLIQRQARRLPGLVADGRDMGSVIFPDAVLKFYLDANPEERALRRFKQLKQQGINVSLEDVLKELVQRDHRDQNREIAPAKPGEDTIWIDTTRLTINQVLQQVIEHANALIEKC